MPFLLASPPVLPPLHFLPTMTFLRPDIVLNLSVPGRYLVQIPSPHLLPYLPDAA